MGLGVALALTLNHVCELAPVMTSEISAHRAASVHESNLPHALSNPDGAGASAEEARHGNGNPEKPLADYQLERAVDLLRGLALIRNAGV
jgi:hypothetical protein